MDKLKTVYFLDMYIIPLNIDYSLLQLQDKISPFRVILYTLMANFICMCTNIFFVVEKYVFVLKSQKTYVCLSLKIANAKDFGNTESH